MVANNDLMSSEPITEIDEVADQHYLQRFFFTYPSITSVEFYCPFAT